MKPTTRLNMTRDNAETIMGIRNRAAKAAGRIGETVMVEGPEDGRYSLMPLIDAVEMGNGYSWSLRS